MAAASSLRQVRCALCVALTCYDESHHELLLEQQLQRAAAQSVGLGAGFPSPGRLRGFMPFAGNPCLVSSHGYVLLKACSKLQHTLLGRGMQLGAGAEHHLAQ